ncbi:MAG: hypothetical protein ACR2GD_11025 [Pyrinomonadaceae bacterium]
MQFSFDTKLNKIAERVKANERLTFDEGVALYKTGDLNALGKLADFVRRKINFIPNVQLFSDRAR